MLEQVLRELGVESLIVTGISTNCCVETTTRDAADLGFGCVVVDEGTADYDAEAHDAALRALYFSFARILGSAEDVVAALEEAHVLGASGTQELPPLRGSSLRSSGEEKSRSFRCSDRTLCRNALLCRSCKTWMPASEHYAAILLLPPRF